MYICTYVDGAHVLWLCTYVARTSTHLLPSLSSRHPNRTNQNTTQPLTKHSEILARAGSSALTGKYLLAADVFSLGASMYEVATRVPLQGSGPEWHRLREGGLPEARWYLCCVFGWLAGV